MSSDLYYFGVQFAPTFTSDDVHAWCIYYLKFGIECWQVGLERGLPQPSAEQALVIQSLAEMM